MSIFVQYAPYNLTGGWTDAKREAFGDAVVNTLAQFAPNLKSSILHRQVITPADIERVTGLTEGNIFQASSPCTSSSSSARRRPGRAMPRRLTILAMRLGYAPGRRHYGRVGPARRARDPEAHMSAAGTAFDAIIIGAGLNGLTTAAYLARGGQRVLVLERRATIGGSTTTEEFAPGFSADTCRHDAGWVPLRIVRELDLTNHGLQLLSTGPRSSRLAPGARHSLSAARARISRRSSAFHPPTPPAGRSSPHG